MSESLKYACSNLNKFETNLNKFDLIDRIFLNFRNR